MMTVQNDGAGYRQGAFGIGIGMTPAITAFSPAIIASQAADYWTDQVGAASHVAGSHLGLDQLRGFRTELTARLVASLQQGVPVVLSSCESGLYGILLEIARKQQFNPHLRLLRSDLVMLVTPQGITANFKIMK